MKFSILLLFVIVTATGIGAQGAAPPFEVASVKENKSGSQNSSNRTAGDRYSGTNVSLISLLRTAYAVQEFQIAGYPAWTFDFRVSWLPDDRFSGRGASANPTLFTAIQEQLGLRLQSGKGPVDTLVIDRAEKPVTD